MAGGRRTPAQCWDVGRLPVAPIIMAGGSATDWCNTAGDIGGQNHPQLRVRTWTSSACHNFSPVSSDSWSRKSPLWQVLMQETASFCCQHQCHHHHHHCHCCLLRIQSPPPACSHMDRVVCQVHPDSIPVGRVDASPRPYRLSGVHPEGACLLWGTCSMQPGKEGEESLHTTSSTPLYWQTSLPTAKGCEVHQPWHLPQSGTAYHCLHDGFEVLGWAGESPSPWPTSSSGRECAGTQAGNGTACFFWGGKGLCDHSAIQMDRSYHAMVHKDHAPASTGIPEAPHWGSWKLPRCWGQKSLWKAIHHQLSLASWLRRPLTPMRS